jgi:hypothetical protein
MRTLPADFGETAAQAVARPFYLDAHAWGEARIVVRQLRNGPSLDKSLGAA